MYKEFFKDVEYVMGLFFKPFEGCCEKDDKEEDEKKGCGMGCDCMPCCKDDGDDADDDDKSARKEARQAKRAEKEANKAKYNEKDYKKERKYNDYWVGYGYCKY